MAKFLCVAPTLINEFWPRVVTFFARATYRSNADYTPEYIKRKLDVGASLLWIVVENKQIVAAMTTEICGLLDTDERVMVITSCGGTLIKHWDQILAQAEKYAKSEACQRVRVYGRPGWARFLRNHGYRQPWIALEKRV